jgi:hypothetical protein
MSNISTRTPSSAAGRSPQERATALTRSFIRKVELVEAAAASPDSVPVHIPQTVKALMEWHDPALGIFRWSSPNVASPSGRYRDLRERFDKALRKIEERTSRVERSRRSPRRDIGQLRERVRSLTDQNAHLLFRDLEQTQEIEKLRVQLKSVQSRLEPLLHAAPKPRPRLVDVSRGPKDDR